jgi:hypothetical protein
MRGTIPPLPQYAFMAWCLVKPRDDFTFTCALRIAQVKTILRDTELLIYIVKEQYTEIVFCIITCNIWIISMRKTAGKFCY